MCVARRFHVCAAVVQAYSLLLPRSLSNRWRSFCTQSFRYLLQELLNTPSLMNVPFLVLGNKADKRDAYREQELRAMLGLTQTTGKEATSRVEGVRPLELYMCSVVKKWGYDKGLAWLMNFM